MRKSFIFLAAAFAAMTVASCRQAEIELIPSEGGRTVKLSFADVATKTFLDADGHTPVWAEGDVIRLLDENAYEDITLTAEDIAQLKGESVTLIHKTKLDGWPLYAIYPASATDMTVGIDEQVIIKIPTVQDGSFAKANICAAMGDEDDMMVFHNVTSVLKITQQEAAVLGIKIEAENAIAGESLVSFTEDGDIYNTLLRPGTTSSHVFVSSDTPKDSYYVVVAPKVSTGNTKLSFIKDDGYAVSNKASKDLVINTLYDLGNIDDFGLEFKTGRGLINGHEYVKVAGLKWATENLYITESGKKAWLDSGCPRGDFFRWGETTLLYDEFKIEAIPSNDNEGAYVFNTFHEDIDGCPPETFWSGWANFNFDKIAEGGRLSKEYDPAFQHWGSSWRMPNGGETNDFETLYNATYWAWDDVNYGCYVFEPDASHPAGTVRIGLDGLNKQDALLYFPACGWALSTAVSNTGYQIRQWTNHYTPGAKKSESLITSFDIIFNADENVINKWNVPSEKVMNKTKYGWWLGYNVRPVSD